METQKQQGQLRQWLQAFVLVGLGLYLLYDMLSGRITLYVNNIQFGWVPWLGTVLFLLIGGVQVFDLMQANRKQELQNPDEHQAHDHAPGEVCEHCDSPLPAQPQPGPCQRAAHQREPYDRPEQAPQKPTEKGGTVVPLVAVRRSGR